MINIGADLFRCSEEFAANKFVVLHNFLQFQHALDLAYILKSAESKNWTHVIGDAQGLTSSRKNDGERLPEFENNYEQVLKISTQGGQCHSYRRMDIIGYHESLNFFASTLFKKLLSFITESTLDTLKINNVIKLTQDDHMSRHKLQSLNTIGFIYGATPDWLVDYGGIITYTDSEEKTITRTIPGFFNTLYIFDINHFAQYDRSVSKVVIDKSVGSKIYIEGGYSIL